MKLRDLSGQIFGRLTVVKRVENDRFGHARWLCKCECGNMTEVAGDKLVRSETKSCGCYHKEGQYNATHGLTGRRVYNIYYKMYNRCYNPNAHNYKWYGARGIKICDEWLHHPKCFYEWAINNGYTDNLTIDRKDVDKDYSPSNCRWATQQEQMNNTRANRIIEINGEKHTMAEWARIKNVGYGKLANRVKKGFSGEALFY